MAFLGGFTIDSVYWVGTTAIRVGFSTTYGTAYLYQLYAGRTRIGVTADPDERFVIGQMQPSLYPQHLTLVAVDPTDRFTDYGDDLPRRPFNRVRLRFSTSSWPADAKCLEVVGATEPGGAVDQANVLTRILFDVDREYEYVTPALSGSGTWDFAVSGIDSRPGGGNEGSALSLSADVLAHPPDVTPQSDGSRITFAVTAGAATIGFTPSF